MWFAVLLSAVLGAVWRRWLGSADTGHRSLKFLAALPLTWPALLVLPNAWALIPMALMLLFWAPGHTVDTSKVWLRYGPFGVAYWLANKYWPEKWNKGRYLDGWMGVGELGIGFLFWGTWALIAALV